jgi:hypothetical protein
MKGLNADNLNCDAANFIVDLRKSSSSCGRRISFIFFSTEMHAVSRAVREGLSW